MHRLLSISSPEKPVLTRFYGNRFQRVLVGCALLAFGITAQAAEPELISLNDAIRKSIEQNPKLTAYVHRLEAAEGDVVQAGVGARAELNLVVEDALGSGNYSAFDSTQTTLSIAWVLDGSLLEQRANAARQKISAVESEQQIKLIDVAAETARRYLTALAFQHRIALAEDAKAQAEDVLQQIRKRVRAGRSPAFDLLRAEADVARRSVEVETLDKRFSSAKRRLAAQWGETTTSFDRLAGDLSLPNSTMTRETVIHEIDNNPNLQWFLTQERIAESEIQLARVEAENRWTVSAGARRFDATDDYALTAGISIPLGGSDRNEGRIRSLSARREAYRSEAQAFRIATRTKLLNLVDELEQARHVAGVLARTVVPKLEQALAEIRDAYDRGRYDFQDWVEVRRELLDARATLLDARLNTRLNQIEIERLTGMQPARRSSEQP